MKWGRLVIACLALGIVFSSIGGSIAKKEETLAHGHTILLRMAPVDPRSLMQGDYMTIGYDQKLFPEREDAEQLPHRGTVILILDEKQEATFARIDDGSQLAGDEIRVQFRRAAPTWRQVPIRYAATSYFFEEGQGKKYEDAQFVMVAVGVGGETILTGLADETGKRIY